MAPGILHVAGCRLHVARCTLMNLPDWEHLLWTGRPWPITRRFARERYLLTDFRIVRIAGDVVEELALDDLRGIERTESRLDRILGTSTIVVRGRTRRVEPLVLAGLRRGHQFAALLELFSSDHRAPRDAGSVRDALAWEPRAPAFALRHALAGFLAMLVALFALAFNLHSTTAAVAYAADDAIAPNGVKRSEADLVRFMETDVMPWARETLGPIKGGRDRITCGTCHGAHAAEVDWRMPGVAALPKPDLRNRGWETYSNAMDAQMRNAMYGYMAESENQTKAAYMREIVLPGMARLLHRPAYDFTKAYDYNRSRQALGCYHCHQVK